MDDIKPEEREILLALHRELNGLKPRRGRATAFYNAVNRGPAGDGGAGSRAGSRSRGTTPAETGSSESSDGSGSDEDTEGSGNEGGSSADTRSRKQRKEGSSSGGRSDKTGVRPAKRARRPPSDEPEAGSRLAQHAAAAAAHVRAAVATAARAAQQSAVGRDADAARNSLAVPDRCKCFVAGIRFGTSLPRSVLGSQAALASAVASAFGGSAAQNALTDMSAARVIVLQHDGRCRAFPQEGSIGGSPAWLEAQQAAARIYVG